uniref:Uncharacterized protein n=1 Tax=Poecilia latipinna TaxID=48699 RepID=A0A3B3VKM1_9TELE
MFPQRVRTYMFKLPWMSTLKGFLLCCSAQQLRLFRRAAPYPSREERTEELKDYYSWSLKLLPSSKCALSPPIPLPLPKFIEVLNPPVKTEVVTPADRRKALYQKFYKQVQEERKPADCVVLSVTNKFL